MQHTRRLTRVQHTKYYSHAFYNCPAHEDGSHAAHEMEVACSTQKITHVSHACSVRVTRQKYENTRVLLHASVNLEMSCTVYLKIITALYLLLYVTRFAKTQNNPSFLKSQIFASWCFAYLKPFL